MRLYKLIDSWMDDFENAEFLWCDKNKLDTPLAAIRKNNTIYLFGGSYTSIMYAPKILFHINGDVLHIDDVLMKHNNVGNGSIAMNALLEYARRNKIKRIEGFLSNVDDDHKERRNHYYEKFGFKIMNSKTIMELR